MALNKLWERLNVEQIFYSTWSEDDQGFVGLCTAYPGLVVIDTTEEDALEGIIEMVELFDANMFDG